MNSSLENSKKRTNKYSPLRRAVMILDRSTSDGLRVETEANDRDSLMEKNGFEYYDSDLKNYESDFEELLYPFKTFSAFWNMYIRIELVS